ncbi:MAG: DMT family transporter [Cryomorphaceae bacterium]|nr:DMT family transporter [Cryomorphaceae bacterium]
MLHGIILIWGFTGILGKLIHLDAYVLVWYRLWIAVFGLGIYLLIRRQDFHSSPAELLKLVGTGIVVGLHWMTFYKAIELSTASLGILCLSTTTLHVTWLEPLIIKKRFSLIEFILGLIVIFGIYFVASDFDSREYEALKYGLLSALLAAMFSVFNAHLSQDISPPKMSFYELLSAFFLLSIILCFSGKINSELFKMSYSDALWLCFLGLICTSFAFLASIEVVKRLGAFTASLSINLEPVYTIILAIVILHENELLSNRFYIGATVIVLVVIANAVIKNFLGRNSLRQK